MEKIKFVMTDTDAQVSELCRQALASGKKELATLAKQLGLYGRSRQRNR